MSQVKDVMSPIWMNEVSSTIKNKKQKIEALDIVHNNQKTPETNFVSDERSEQ